MARPDVAQVARGNGADDQLDTGQEPFEIVVDPDVGVDVEAGEEAGVLTALRHLGRVVRVVAPEADLFAGGDEELGDGGAPAAVSHDQHAPRDVHALLPGRKGPDPL